ncbi:MAG: hypothetical protein USCGTAYLOR_03018 [Chromatiales bacterium USCg_Taylor]|nr:MAG: hypothetical protein USCGTAYLOR_03018 [Chromatiales bacterium USCg_Taylor]
MVHGLVDPQAIDPADHLVYGAEAEQRHLLAHLLGDVAEEGLDELGRARELLAQLRVLRGDPDRTGVEVTDAHHDAAHDHERRRREPELLGTEQGRDDDVAAGLELAVGLHHDAIAELVGHQHLLGLRQTQLPGNPRVLQGGHGRGPGPAVVTRDQDHIGVGLGDPCGDGPDPDLGHELDVDTSPRVRVLEVVDELRQVFDRVDVVMGRRRDQPHRRCRVTYLGDPGIHLAARQLAALTGLRPLRHLDLQVVGAGEVLAGHTETPRSDLLDGATARIAVGIEPVARRVLPALAGVGPGAHAVHGDGQGLVGLLADGAVGHGAGREALDDYFDGLDLLDRHRRGRRF